MLINELKLIFISGLLLTLVSTATFTVDVLRFPFDEAEFYSGSIDMEYGKESSLILPNLKTSDKVFISLHTPVSTDLVVLKGSNAIVTAPFEIEGRSHVFVDYLVVTKRYFFIAEETGDYALCFTPLTPKTPYNFVKSGNLNISVSQTLFNGHKMLNVTLSSFKNMDERFPKIFLIYPVNITAKGDFKVSGIIGLSNGGVSMVTIDIVDETDYAFYSYLVLEYFVKEGTLRFFEVNMTSEEMYGLGDISGDNISFICVGMGLDKLHYAFENENIVYASVLLGDLNISNGGKLVKVDAEAQNVFSVPYEAYILTKYRPSHYVYILQSFIIIGLIMVGAVIFTWGKRKR